ncbi:Protein URA2 [Dirofilaria immitis]
MYCDIGSISLGKSYSDNSVSDSLKSWSSPFSISSYEDDNLKTAVTRPSEVPGTGYSDRSENRQTFARSMDDMDVIKVDHNLQTTEEMFVSFQKQPNHSIKPITNFQPDINTQAIDGHQYHIPKN